MNPLLEELACLYVLDRLDPGERATFEASLLHDPALQQLVRDLEAVVARRIHTLPQHAPPAGLLSEIEARIEALSFRTTLAARPPSRPWITAVRWGMAALIAVGLGTIALELRHRSGAPARPFVIIVGLDSSKNTLAELPLSENPKNADESFVQLASLAQQYWEKPQDLPENVRSASTRGRGYALFDPAHEQGFIAVQSLPPAEQGKCYHFWIVDTSTGQTREAGILPASSTRGGLYFFSVSPDKGAKPERLDFFLTSEDVAAPKSTGPKGRVILGDRRI